ncbi:HAD family hydrolase [Pseudarthrobacter raffinosi]|uniref:HAD family hydrolase n=1 Tax=Pseudarthrobacter raffinosi TaxID=2953651 RepID=UPI00208ECC20|nr:HAD family hydrolase [Pseudarthrobacter sp. MDT3-9]MCO4253427.1 HAD family hydrolase [Pseudarthrobacter sp. MDT3-9]
MIDEADENALVYLGVAGIIGQPRAEAAAAVAEARRAGIRVAMITGDHPVTAARIASDLGNCEPGDKALTGAQLDELDDAGLRAVTGSTSVYARVSSPNSVR